MRKNKKILNNQVTFTVHAMRNIIIIALSHNRRDKICNVKHGRIWRIYVILCSKNRTRQSDYDFLWRL